MNLSELFFRGAVCLDIEADDLAGACRTLTRALRDQEAVTWDVKIPQIDWNDPGKTSGSVTCLFPGVTLVALSDSRGGALNGAIGVFPTGFGGACSEEKEDDFSRAKIIILLVSDYPVATLHIQTIPAIRELFKQEGVIERVGECSSPAQLLSLPQFADTEVHERLLVGDLFSPVTYRVYPETPLEEVIDLMARRELRALPVVGEDYELLGILTAGDLLKHLLPARIPTERSRRGSEDRAEPTAREAMTRTVMCVSEEQGLLEAAHTMVNKRIHQLPVVREGRVIGFLTRNRVLSALAGSEEFLNEKP